MHYEISPASQRTSFFYDGTQLPPKATTPSEAASHAPSAHTSVASSRMSWGRSSGKGTGSVALGKLGQAEEEEEEISTIWCGSFELPWRPLRRFSVLVAPGTRA